ncbi:hypothetical protein EDD11_006976 [Mortierella claussenii]|nr:hypothetical protein EDD11_006976 [Mortierella claussenii]
MRYLEYMQVHREALETFYYGGWYVKHMGESRKAQRAAMDLAIKGLMRMAGVSNVTKVGQGQQEVVFAFGLGSFNSRTGLPSKHGIFLQHWVKKPRGPYHLLGYSFKALVVRIMASYLEEQSESVAFVAFMDTFANHHKQLSTLKKDRQDAPEENGEEMDLIQIVAAVCTG